jgi:hypothetical protein
LLTHEQRVKEFKRLRDIGIKGLKIDFFAGDGQSMIAYYNDILRDAADAGLLVNFHGATLPRGWSRTWPNLMTMEAIRGFEFTTFEQKDQDLMPSHAAMLPFTRNLFDPMDFTPMVFGDIPNIRAPAPTALSWPPRCSTCPASSTSPTRRKAWPPRRLTSGSSCKTCRAAGTIAGTWMAIPASTP